MEDEYSDDQFCWNEEKNESNFQNHGIWFQDVRPLFFQLAAYFDSTRKEYGEIRTIAIGSIEDVYFVIAFTQRERKVRIISARRATSGEIARFKEHKKRWRQYFNYEQIEEE